MNKYEIILFSKIKLILMLDFPFFNYILKCFWIFVFIQWEIKRTCFNSHLHSEKMILIYK